MYEVFEHLLQSFGVSAYKFCKDTGIPQSTIYTIIKVLPLNCPMQKKIKKMQKPLDYWCPI